MKSPQQIRSKVEKGDDEFLWLIGSFLLGASLTSIYGLLKGVPLAVGIIMLLIGLMRRAK